MKKKFTLYNIHKSILFFFCCSLLILINSCAQYQSIYTPPYNELGMKCINQCATNNQLCQSNCEMTKSRDRMTNASERQTAAKYKTYMPQYVNTQGDCNCQTQYDQCYLRCGGNIQVVCIANCN